MKTISLQSLVATAVILCSALLVTPTQATMVALMYGRPVIADSVTHVETSTWKYDFSVTNNAVAFSASYANQARLTEYLLPYFSDAALSAKEAPTDWAWRIDADDRFNWGVLSNGCPSRDPRARSIPN